MELDGIGGALMDEMIGEKEFERALNAVLHEMRSGFSGVNGRLDRVNGRLDSQGAEIHEVLKPAIKEHAFRIEALSQRTRADGAGGTETRGLALTLPTDPKTIAAVVATCGAIISAIVAWMRGGA